MSTGCGQRGREEKSVVKWAFGGHLKGDRQKTRWIAKGGGEAALTLVAYLQWTIPRFGYPTFSSHANGSETSDSNGSLSQTMTEEFP